MAIAQHPFSGQTADAVEAKAELLLERLVEGLTTH